MPRALKWTIGIVATLAILVVGAVFTLTNTDWGREQVRSRVVGVLNDNAHGIVRVGRISGNILRGLTLHDVSITDSTGAPFVAAAEIRAGYGLRSLYSRKIDLRDVELRGARIVLEQDFNRRWNYDRIFPRDTSGAQSDTAGIQFGDWVVLHDVRVTRSALTVRAPWNPDASLGGAARDSAVTVALTGKSRTTVVRVAGGLQQVQEFRNIEAKLPLVRVAHPDFRSRRIEVDSLRTLALAFAPPAVDVRALQGAFEIDADSVWFSRADVTLPASRATIGGSYRIENGDLRLDVLARPVALADVRFLYPALPSEGNAKFDLALSMTDSVQRYTVRNLDLTSGTAKAQGAVGLTVADTLRLHETDLTFSGIRTALLEQLIPALDAPRQGVLAGHAKVDGTLTAMRVDGDVTFDDTRSGTSRVIAAGEIGASNGVVRARDLHVTLAPMQMDLARVAVSDFPLGGTLTGRATVNGASNTLLTASAMDLTHRERGELSRVTGRGAIRVGGGTFLDFNLQGQPVSLVTVGRFAPALGLRGSVTGPLQMRGPLRDLAFTTNLRASDGGAISATGRLDVASKEIGYNVEAATVLFNASSLVTKAPSTSLSAELSAVGRGFDPATMVADLTAHATTSTVDTIAVDSLRARVRIAGGVATIDTVSLRAPGAAVDAVGTFGLSKHATGSLTYAVSIDSLGKLVRYFPRDTGLVLPRPERTAAQLARLRADSARLAQRLAVARAAGAASAATPVVVDTPAALPRDSLAGALRANGTLRGGLGGFDAEGRATGTGLLVMGNAAQRLRLQYSVKGALTPEAAIDATANADSVSAAGFALDSLETQLTYRKPGGTARVAVFQDNDRDYLVRADYAIYTDRRELLFNQLRMRFDSTTWTSTHPGALRWGQPGIEIDSLEIRNPSNGRVFVDGRLPTEGAANLRVEVANFQVGDLLGLLQSDVPGRGLLTLNSTVTGTGAAPLLSGDVRVDSARYAGTVVPDVKATFDYANVKLTAKADATYVGRTIASANGVVPLNLALKGVEGSRLPDEPATIDMRADSLPLELASRFTDAVSQIQGFAAGVASLRGPIRSPKIEGNANVKLGQAKVNALGIVVRDVTGNMRMTGDTVIIDSLTANSGGRLAITGGLGIAKLAEPSFDLRFDATNARVLDNEQGRIRADARIAMTGPFNDVDVRGRAQIREGVYYIPDSDQKEVINAGDPAVFAVIDTSNVNEVELVPGQSPFLNNLRMNLRLGVDRDTWVRSEAANVEVYTDGDLRVNVDRRRQTLTLDGVVNTDRGEYEFLSKRFQIKRGTATFVGTQEINPLLQLTGEYEVKQASRQALFIRVLIGGTLTSPRLTLESDAQPPISQSDLLSYLAFGSESGSVLQFGGSSLSGGTAGGGLVGTSAALATRQLAGVAIGQLVKDFEGQAARSLGADVLNITPANVPTELASTGAVETFLKGTQVEFGKYFTTQTFLGLQAQFDAVPGFRAEHRFRRNPGLSLETTFQPRFFLPEPSLSEQELRKANSFGLFLIRRWKF